MGELPGQEPTVRNPKLYESLEGKAREYFQLALPGLSLSAESFRRGKPLYQDGSRYDYQVRWYLDEAWIPGVHREEVAKLLHDALTGKPPIKYSRTNFRHNANLVIKVGGYYGNVLVGPGHMVALIRPKDIAKLSGKILLALGMNEA